MAGQGKETAGAAQPRTVGVVGLGLIGGSLAKAYKAAGWTVYGRDTAPGVEGYAALDGVLDGALDEAALLRCCLVHIAVPPVAAVSWLEAWAPRIGAGTVVIDDCGTKRRVCAAGFALAARYGFTFAGGHPMAGSHLGGYAHSRDDLFFGAPMIIVPPVHDDIALLDRLKRLLAPLGLRRVVFTTAEDHDRMIAYTSQLPHIVSNAFIKSPQSQQHKGYSAGSFRDLTRVAWLDERLWTELFLENKDYLIGEVSNVITHLQQYAEALEAGDAAGLEALLKEGRIAKELSEQ